MIVVLVIDKNEGIITVTRNDNEVHLDGTGWRVTLPFNRVEEVISKLHEFVEAQEIKDLGVPFDTQPTTN